MNREVRRVGQGYRSGEYVERPRTMRALLRKWAGFVERLRTTAERHDEDTFSPPAVQLALAEELVTDLRLILDGTDGHGRPIEGSVVRVLNRRKFQVPGQMKLPPERVWSLPLREDVA